MGIRNSRAFLSEWNKIHHIRNKATHTSKVYIDDLDEMKKALMNLATTHAFESLANLKKIYITSKS